MLSGTQGRKMRQGVRFLAPRMCGIGDATFAQIPLDNEIYVRQCRVAAFPIYSPSFPISLSHPHTFPTNVRACAQLPIPLAAGEPLRFLYQRQRFPSQFRLKFEQFCIQLAAPSSPRYSSFSIVSPPPLSIRSLLTRQPPLSIATRS